MKTRIEPQGLHYYCRKSGTHILFDEIETKPSAYSLAPRTVSIAITDECDFTCSYCYVNLKDRYLKKEDVILYCKQLDRLGTFDIAFGGGEIAERHLERAADLALEAVHRTGEAVGRQPLRQRIGFDESAIDLVGLGGEYAVQFDGAGHGGFS